MSTETIPTLETEQATKAVNPEALYEIVDGERVELADLAIYSCRIVTRLFNKMNLSGLESLGSTTYETLFVLDEDGSLRRRPDVAFVSAERWPLDKELPETGDWKVIPDLCVEVNSPHDLYKDVVHKLHEYFAYGVQEVWLVLPEDRQVHVYETPETLTILQGEDFLKDRKLLPGFEIALTELFDRKP